MIIQFCEKALMQNNTRVKDAISSAYLRKVNSNNKNPMSERPQHLQELKRKPEWPKQRMRASMRHEAKEVSTKSEAGAILKGVMGRHKTCKRSKSKSRDQ